jgi:3-hydroxyacyl-[acyl-carrier-protein] dehydratase
MKEAQTARELGTADIDQIMRMIPHRYPMLMIDHVVEMVAHQSAVGIKNVTINEPHFQGHFPGHPIMPGVMMVEAMAQTAAVLVVHSEQGIDPSDKLVYFTAIENAKFRHPVVPGDCLRIEIEKRHCRGNMWKFEGQCVVDGRVVAEASFGAMMLDPEGPQT